MHREMNPKSVVQPAISKLGKITFPRTIAVLTHVRWILSAVILELKFQIINAANNLITD